MSQAIDPFMESFQVVHLRFRVGSSQCVLRQRCLIFQTFRKYNADSLLAFHSFLKG
jgi:hypothetical protein